MRFRPLAPETSARLSGLRILVAEDEPLVSMEMEDVILEHGAIPIGPFTTLRDLLKAVDAGGYDVAILDVRLGRDESFPAADRLKSDGVPFIFHSGHASRREIAGAYPRSLLCRKPCAPEQLLEAALYTIDIARAA
jgi:DNA-binding NarL/FixJ family response regulator